MKKQIITKNGKFIQLDNQILAVEMEDTLKKLLTTTKSTQYMFANNRGITPTIIETVFPLSLLEKVEDANHMFYKCSGLNDITNWNLGSVKNASYMFSNSGLESIVGINMDNVVDASYMFNQCVDLKRLPSIINANNVTNANYMFYEAYTNTNHNLEGTLVVNMPNLTDAIEMFGGLRCLDNITLNAPNITTAKSIFRGAYFKKINLQGTEGWQNAEGAFKGCSYLTELSGLKLPNVTNMKEAFYQSYCTPLNIEITSPYLTTLANAFTYTTCIEKVKINTNICTNISSCFSESTFIRNIELSSLDAVTSSSSAFSSAYSLKYCIIRTMNKTPTLNSGAFSKSFCKEEGAGIYVPDNMVETLKTATNWSAYADIIYPLSSLPETYDDETYVARISPLTGQYWWETSDQSYKRFFERELAGNYAAAKIVLHIGRDNCTRKLIIPVRLKQPSHNIVPTMNIYKPDSTEVFHTFLPASTTLTNDQCVINVSNLEPGYHEIKVEYIYNSTVNISTSNYFGAYFEGSQE